MDTYEKKHECFLNGLNDGLSYALEAETLRTSEGWQTRLLFWRTAEV
jgi:hypothetical protein